jgi:AraC-like DNA-binding protein
MPESILASYVRTIRRAIDAAGYDGVELLRQAGLEPSMLKSPEARYPFSSTGKLWEAAIKTTRDEAFGLRVASYYSLNTFHALGYCLSTSVSLKDAFERLVRYCHIASDAVEYDFTRRGDEYWLTIRSASNLQLPPEFVDCLVAGFMRMCRSLLGFDYSPLAICLRRRSPKDVTSFARILRAPMQFNSTEDRVIFDAKTIERQLEGGNAELARHSDTVALQYLSRIEAVNIPARVRVAIMARLRRGPPSMEQVAASLNMGSRTLQRKLRDSGTTFAEIVDETRRDMALGYLRGRRHSIGEIMHLLGFASASSFTRAFRRWTGTAPSDWRDSAS